MNNIPNHSTEVSNTLSRNEVIMVKKKITIKKDQLVGALLDSGRFPGEEEDFEVIDEIWDTLCEEA